MSDNSKTERGLLHSMLADGVGAPSEEPSGPLPAHVEKMESGWYACMHCGGEVGEDGESFGEPEQEEDLDETERRARLGFKDEE